jgi:hypothetical protein
MSAGKALSLGITLVGDAAVWIEVGYATCAVLDASRPLLNRFRFNLGILALNGCKISAILYCFGYLKNPNKVQAGSMHCA